MTPFHVTVLLTVYNTPGAWLIEAVRSLESEAPRVMIVDDGSTDTDTLSALNVLRGHWERVHRIDHAGIAAASNYGVRQINTPLIARLDADDRLLPGALAAELAHLEAHPNVDVVSGSMHYMRPDGSRFDQVVMPPMTASTGHHGRIVHSGCMFRRALWERTGGYPNMRAPDWHLWDAAQKVGARFSVLPVHVIERRIHPDSYSFAHSRHLQNYWRKAQK